MLTKIKRINQPLGSITNKIFLVNDLFHISVNIKSNSFLPTSPYTQKYICTENVGRLMFHKTNDQRDNRWI